MSMATHRVESWAPGAPWRNKKRRHIWHWMRPEAPIAVCSPHVRLATDEHFDRPPVHTGCVCRNCMSIHERAMARRKDAAA